VSEWLARAQSRGEERSSPSSRQIIVVSMRVTDPDRRRLSVLRKIDAMPLVDDKKRALRDAAIDLLEESRVRGVAIYGSASHGKPAPRDLDLIVLVPGNKTWTRRRLYHGQSVHMQMRGVERFRLMNIERKQARSERCPAFADLITLWDDTDSFSVARARCRRLRARGPKPVSRWEADRMRAELTEFMEQMESESGDSATFALLAAQCLSRCITVHLRLRANWVPEQKDLFRALESTDEGLAGRYKQAISLLSKPADCIETTRAIVNDALAPVGGIAEDYEVWYR